jgi:hypothetical protein
MFGVSNACRIRKTSKVEKLSDGAEETYTHYLTFWKTGLRIVVTKFLPTGHVHIILVNGKPEGKGFKELRRCRLEVPSTHQVDVMVSILLDHAYRLSKESKK